MTSRYIGMNIAVVWGLVGGALVACHSGDSGVDGEAGATLSIAVGHESAQELRETPTLGRLDQSVFVKVTDGWLTVFIAIPRPIATVGMIPVGAEAGREATVWIQSGRNVTPLIATEGALTLNELELQSGGRFAGRLDGVYRPEDARGVGFRLQGEIAGTWP